MTFSQFLFKLLFPRYLGLLRSYEMRLELLKAPPPTVKAEIPDDLYGGNWELDGFGDQNEGDRVTSGTPKKCPCGNDWACNNDSKILNARPAPADIANLYAGIAEPATGTCDGECIAKEIFRGKCWVCYRNKVTGKFWLYCSKRVAWHCEIEG